MRMMDATLPSRQQQHMSSELETKKIMGDSWHAVSSRVSISNNCIALDSPEFAQYYLELVL